MAYSVSTTSVNTLTYFGGTFNATLNDKDGDLIGIGFVIMEGTTGDPTYPENTVVGFGGDQPLGPYSVVVNDKENIKPDTDYRVRVLIADGSLNIYYGETIQIHTAAWIPMFSGIVEIEGVEWEGLIACLGTGKDFTTLNDFLDYYEALGTCPPVVFLVYENMEFSGNGEKNSWYIRGIGEDITLSGSFSGSGFSLYLDNVIIGYVRPLGTSFTLKTNKAQISGAWTINAVTVPSGEVAELSYTTIFRGQSASHYSGGEDLTHQELNKVAYDFTWSGSTGFAVEDKAVDGTEGYGYNYGTAGNLIKVIEGMSKHYYKGKWIKNNHGSFWCILEHDASSDTEPGVGVNWRTYWIDIYPALHSDLQDVQGGDEYDTIHLTEEEFNKLHIPHSDDQQSSDFNHDELSNITGGNIHLTEDEYDNLHAPGSDNQQASDFNHNDLSGIQMGEDEYDDIIHITSDEKELLNSLINETKTFSITVENPTSSEDICLGQTKMAITITEITSVIVGTGTPSCTINPCHGTDRSSATNTILDSATAITNTTSGTSINGSSLNDNTIPKNSWIVLKTTASTTCTQLTVTFKYTIDK